MSSSAELNDFPRTAVAVAGALFHEARERTPLWELDTATARKEGWLVNGLVNDAPATLRPDLHTTIAAFDADCMAVPLLDVVPEPTSLVPGGAKTGVVFRANHRIVFVASQPLWRSRFTKFRVAVDTTGQAYAIKQFMSDRAGLVPAWDNQPTETPLVATPMAMIVREVSLARFLGGHLMPQQVLRYGSEIFIVMPLMQDTLATLAADIPQADKASVARGIARQLARQLMSFHARNVSHTDVKLSNALWDREGRAILSDFGLVTALADGFSQKRHRGTPRCGAPEVTLGLPFTDRVDTWSLGILITEFHQGDSSKNPFSANPDDFPNGQAPMHARWYFAAAQSQQFAMWRRRFMRGDQLLFAELLMAVEEDTVWARFFKPLVHQDPELAGFVLGRMLDDTAYSRASMRDVVVALDGMDDAMAPADVRWSKLPARDPRRQNALHALRQLVARLSA